MKGSEAPLHMTPESMRDRPSDPGHPSAHAFRYGTLEVRWYAPHGASNPQEPHDRNEVYIVVSGTGTFVRATESRPLDDQGILEPAMQRVRFQPGDVLFVPAGTQHHFEEFSEDCGTWAVFYGPEGGELE